MKGIPLEETELFRSLSADVQQQVASLLQLRSFDTGQYLYFESHPASYLWVVQAGEVRTLKTSSSGRVTTLEHLRPGDLFGIAALTGGDHPESAQAVTPGAAWCVPRHLLTAVFDRQPQLGYTILGIVASRLRSAHDRLCAFAHEGVPARLARVIVDEATTDCLKMTRKALGESAGTTVETTIRVLRRFERFGWVEGGIGWIRILDRRALEAIAEGKSPDE